MLFGLSHSLLTDPLIILMMSAKPTGKKTLKKPIRWQRGIWDVCGTEALMHFKGAWAVSISASFSHSLHRVLFLIPNDCWLRFNPNYLFKKASVSLPPLALPLKDTLSWVKTEQKALWYWWLYVSTLLSDDMKNYLTLYTYIYIFFFFSFCKLSKICAPKKPKKYKSLKSHQKIG